MKLTSERVVSTLDDLDLLSLDADGPWPGEPDPEAYSTYEVDWRRVDEGLDELQADDRFLAPDGWGRVREELHRVGERGRKVPPPDVLDALAWYLPIHYYGLDSAIYIREEAILDTAGMIIRRLPEHRRSQTSVVMGAVRAGLTVLYLHEAFHHKVESFAIRLEVIEHARRYVPYHESVYTRQSHSGSDDLLEEALACAEMKRRLGETVYKRSIPQDVWIETKRMVDEWIPIMPAGYRRGVDYFGEASYRQARNLLSSQLHEARETPMRRSDEWILEPKSFEGFFNCQDITPDFRFSCGTLAA